MATSYIKGDFFLIRVWETAGAELIAGCNTSDTLQLNREFIEKTPISGQFKAYIPTFLGGTLAFDSVVFFTDDTTNHPTDVYFDWMMNATLLNFSVTYTDGTLTDGLEGQCYLQSLSITGSVDEFATGNFQLLISGQITRYEAPS